MVQLSTQCLGCLLCRLAILGYVELNTKCLGAHQPRGRASAPHARSALVTTAACASVIRTVIDAVLYEGAHIS